MRKTIIFIIIVVTVGVGVFFIFHTPKKKTSAPVHLTQTVKTTEFAFSDGLPKATYNTDINNDGLHDIITRTETISENAHGYYEYKIELNTANGFIDITPPNFRTISGADCALQKIKFVFGSKFSAIKISRPWEQSWTTPTIATRTVYELKNNKLISVSQTKLHSVCDVSELF